jgi:hypothetical protein
MMLEPPAAPSIQGVRVGHLVVVDTSKGVWVTYEGRPTVEPLKARSTVTMTPDDAGRSVLLMFEDGDPERPVITGFIQDQPVTMTLDKDTVEDARADGKRVCLEAQREMVLRCGKSSLTLRSDGKIVIRGVEIVSRARRANKVKGGTVRIN